MIKVLRFRSQDSRYGFTLIESVVAIFIAAVLLGGIIGIYSVLVRSVRAGREQSILAALTSNYLEVVRNLPYSKIGTTFGNPNGTLADQSSPIQVTIEGTLYKIYYEVTYIDDPADGTALAGTDPTPNDYKQVKMNILNTSTSVVRSFLTNVSPKGLEGTINAGALSISVINAQGQPVQDAAIHIQNTAGTIILDRTADSSGKWIEVGLPPGVNAYHISVTKSGYSTDQTYPISAQNPNPIKPDSTITVSQVTSVSFSIDLLASLTINTLDSTCHSLSNIGVNLAGSKLIGTNPNVLKYNQNLTSSAGAINLNNFEWDVYTPTLLTGQNLMVLGTSPIQQISVLPQANQTYTMILGAQTTNSLLVIVKDSSSGLALEGANVELQKVSPVLDQNLTTGGSVWSQSDWSSGSGQTDFVNSSEYFSDDGNIDVTTQPTGVRLKQIGNNYASSGTLISSSFDTGGTSTYTTISWQPTSQTAGTTVRFQLASNNDDATWNFVGPDGTANSYYTVAGTNISSVHNNNRYIRYKLFLDTTSTTKTPVLSNIGINYVSGCFTPGQVSFGGLAAGSDYSVTVSLSGYTSQTISNLNISGNQSLQVLLGP